MWPRGSRGGILRTLLGPQGRGPTTQEVIRVGKGSRLKQQPRKTPAETHEPAVPVNWPEGHVKVEMTGDDDLECITVTIHGVRHYLHATTARELELALHRKLDEWNAMSRQELGKLGMKHEEV